MSEAIANWLGLQQRVVEVSGRHAERLHLLGPDDKPWGVWSISAEKLAEQVEMTLVGLQEQLPSGKHRGQLVVYDNKGDQWAAFPVVMQGRNAQAATAAQETRTLQQATAIAISNLEAVNMAYRNVLDVLSTQLEILREDNAQLTELVQGYQTDNIEVQLKIREHEERKERLDKLAEVVGPPLQMLVATFGEKVIARALAAQKKKEAKPNDAPKPNGAGLAKNGAGSGASAGPEPVGSGAGKPADSSSSDSRVRVEGAKASDGSSDSAQPDEGGVSKSRRRRRTEKRQQAPLKPRAKRKAAKAVHAKPLTRKKKGQKR